MPDAALVEILDEASSYKHSALSVACVKWVADEGLQPIPIETKVISTSPREKAYGVGIVTENHKDGRATVYYASKGHVREGIGTHGLILPWEELEIQNEQPTI